MAELITGRAALKRPDLTEAAGRNASPRHFYPERAVFTDGRIITHGGMPVRFKRVTADGYNPDPKNPNAKADSEHLPLEQPIDDNLRRELRVAGPVRESKGLPGRKP